MYKRQVLAVVVAEHLDRDMTVVVVQIIITMVLFISHLAAVVVKEELDTTAVISFIPM